MSWWRDALVYSYAQKKHMIYLKTNKKGSPGDGRRVDKHFPANAVKLF